MALTYSKQRMKERAMSGPSKRKRGPEALDLDPFDPSGDIARIEKLRPIDDEFMRCIFRDQLPLAQEALRIITGIGDLVLTREETQRDVRRLAGARSVILDVWGEDSEGRVYDLEVQRAELGASPRRARYHSAVLDVEALGAGMDFSKLPETYVVLVTEGDVIGKGADLYRFERRDGATGVDMGDGTHVLYANAESKGDGPFADLMHDFMCVDPDDMRIPSLAARASYLKRTEEGVEEMSGVLDDLREECRLWGRQEGKLSTLNDLVCKGAISMRQAAEFAGMTPEQFVAAVKQLEADTVAK